MLPLLGKGMRSAILVDVKISYSSFVRRNIQCLLGMGNHTTTTAIIIIIVIIISSNLLFNASITLKEALCGFELHVPSIEGDKAIR